MKWYFNKLMRWKQAFELLAEHNLIDLETEINYWRILDLIEEICQRYPVIL